MSDISREELNNINREEPNKKQTDIIKIENKQNKNRQPRRQYLYIIRNIVAAVAITIPAEPLRKSETPLKKQRERYLKKKL